METTATTASASRDEFLNLLVTQLRHQDPLSPVAQEDMVAQLAQFSSLEGIETLNSNFEKFLKVVETQQRGDDVARAANLIGREVTYHSGNVSADGVSSTSTQAGTVDRVVLSNDRIQLHVNGNTVAIENILEIAANLN